MSRRAPNPSQWLNFDALGIVVFVLIGRDEHDSAGGTAVGATLRTAAPFLIAMFVGWLLAKAWRAPDTWRTGCLTWATTLVLGMVLRRVVWGKGTALPFVIVAACFLALTMFSWRVVSRSIHRRFGELPDPDAPPGH